MSRLSAVMEILRRYPWWDEALEAHTVILPDAGDDLSYWPIRRWAPLGEPVGVRVIWPEDGFHGAWYLREATEAAKQGWFIYIPERRGCGLSPVEGGAAREDEAVDRAKLASYLKAWHPDLSHVVWTEATVPESRSRNPEIEELASILKSLDRVLGRETQATDYAIEQRVAAEWCASRFS